MDLNEMLASWRASSGSDGYWTEAAKIEFANKLERQMRYSGMNKSNLAEKLGTSKAYITKVMRGDANLTIETMVKLARAVGGTWHSHISPEGSSVRWFDVLVNQPRQSEEVQSMELVKEWSKSVLERPHEYIPAVA